MRLGVDEVGVTELMGVTEHARAMATAAAALLLDSLESEAALIQPLPSGTGEVVVEALLGEISAWTQTAMARRTVPAIWRVLARNAFYLEATWRKETALMAPGVLAARDKRRVALAVAMATRARYMIEYHAAVLRHAGDTDRDLLEILGVVDHYTTLNTVSEAMQIQSDIRPPAGNP
jgi:alkylhydroperoxidase/carboxymuconolactone decarboxylase family protein YurZ